MAVKADTLLLLGFLAFIAWGSGLIPGFSAAGGGAGDGAINVNVQQTDKACGSTTMTMDFIKKYSSSTDMTSENGTVYVNGNRRSIVSEGSTFTAQGGDMLDVYYALDPAGSTYAAAHGSGEIACTGQTAAFATSDILAAGELTGAMQDPPHELYQLDSGQSVTIINADNTLNTGGGGSTAQSVTAGQTRNIEVNLFPTFEDGLGVAGGNTLACQFTDTEWDQANSVISLGGTVLDPATYVPSSTLFPLEATNRTAIYRQVPPIDGAKSSELDFLFKVKGDDNNQPTSTGDWNCTIFDSDLYETDSDDVKVDVEDRDDNTNVGVSNDFAFYIDFS